MKTIFKNTIPGLTFPALFMLALLTPLILTDPHGGRISPRENRTLAARPPVSGLFIRPGEFIRELDMWFTDNLGLREQMIDVYNALGRLDTTVQFTDGTWVYLKGGEGHHYFAGSSGEMIPKFQGAPILNEAQLDELGAKLGEINDYLKQKDIPLILMLCADKETIYPKYYPKSISRGPEPVPLDIVTDYLKESTDADVFSIKEGLIREKENFLLYNKAGGDLTHYNEVGAYFSYLELMERIRVYWPDMPPITLDDLEISYNNGDVPDVSLKTGNPWVKLENSFFDPITLERPFTWENSAFENEDSSLPVILIMRDSYAGVNFQGRLFAESDFFTGKEEFLTRFLPAHFYKTILIHYMNMGRLKEYADFYKPDIVVLQSAERQLEWFANLVMEFR